MKTNELIDEALDWAVAKCAGYRLDLAPEGSYTPSTNWSQGGPIIEREKIGFRFSGDFGFCAWKSYGIGPHQNEYSQYGPAPLIAAMRCYVASKLGDQVDIPEQV